jgi:hypothetical protein
MPPNPLDGGDGRARAGRDQHDSSRVVSDRHPQSCSKTTGDRGRCSTGVGRGGRLVIGDRTAKRRPRPSPTHRASDPSDREHCGAGAGDPRPTLIQHSEGSRYRANLVASGDIVPGKAWSYLIAERGHFVFNDTPGPPGSRAPSGSVITLVVDAATGEITDYGVSDRYPRLAVLGPLKTDLRRAVAAAAAP